MQSEMAARTAAAKRDGTPRRRSKKCPEGDGGGGAAANAREGYDGTAKLKF